MKLSMQIAASALVLSLGSGLCAQVRTLAAFTGNSELGVLNVGRATSVASAAPRGTAELWAEGDFLGYRGRFYTSYLEGNGSSSNIGTGLWSLRAGTTAVASGWIVTFFTGPETRVVRDVKMTQQMTVGGVPLTANGTVTVDLSISARWVFARFGVMIETKSSSKPMLSGDARASVTTTPALPVYTATPVFALFFGSQKLEGKIESWITGDSSSLDYEMGPMFLYLKVYTSFLDWLHWNRQIVLSSRSGYTRANFL